MVGRRRTGDRREYLRFDVSGQLWGALERRDQAVLRNIAVGGALLEATLGPSVKSLRAVQLQLRGGGPPIDAVIRHITPAADEGRVLVGLEFVNVSATTRVELDRFVLEWAAHAER